MVFVYLLRRRMTLGGRYHLLALTALLGGTACLAHADDFSVDIPDIEAHELSVESSMAYELDKSGDTRKDNYFSHVDGITYGLNDHWEFTLSGEFEKYSSHQQKLTYTHFEGKYVPFKPGALPVDVGFGIKYSHAMYSNQPDNGELHLLLHRNLGPLSLAGNIITSREFGPDRSGGWSGGGAAQISYPINDYLTPGIEYYADVGPFSHMPSYQQQGHMLGPAVQGEWHGLSYDTGVLFGISHSAPDATVKLNIGYTF